MDIFNITSLNNSSSQRIGILERIMQFYTTANANRSAKVNLSICPIGIPSNLLVVITYIGRMKTSTRVYMLALAVVDLVSSICGTAIPFTPIHTAPLLVLYVIGDLCIISAILLLAFIAIERLIAVMRPYVFNFNAGRAKTVVVVVAVMAVTFTSALESARLTNSVAAAKLVPVAVTVPSFLVMIVSYFLMGVILLKRVRTRHTQVAPLNMISSVMSAVASNSADVITNVPGQMQLTVPRSRTKIPKQSKKYHNVLLLFTVTAVYIVCWLPVWIHYAGVYIPRDVLSMFLLNAVVNPFIYSVVSAMFRSDVKIVFRQIRSRLTTCRQ